MASAPTLDVTVADNESGDLTLSSTVHYTGWTSTHSLSISAGTGLGTVTASVNIGPGANGLLTTTASLSDPGDGATPVTQTLAVDVTTPPAMALSLSGTPAGATAGTDYALTIVPSVAGPAGPAYNDPTLVVTLPNGESFTTSATSPSGWACALSAANTMLTCTSTTFTPIAAGSSLPDVPMTVVIATSARGALTADASLSDSPDDATAATATATVTVTAPPVLALATSGTPASASAPSSYPLTLTPSLRSSGGAAYSDHPTLSVSLPYGETFQSPAPTPSGWSCSYSSGNSDLGCTSTASGSLAPGSSLASVTVTVDMGSGASGTLTTTATFSDRADLATPVAQDPAVGITPAAPPSGGPEPPAFPVTSHFGDARNLATCTTSAKACQKLLGKISSVASAATGQGYWLVASGGRVFAFGAAKFLGDVYTTKDQKALRGTVVGLTAMGNNAGYLGAFLERRGDHLQGGQVFGRHLHGQGQEIGRPLDRYGIDLVAPRQPTRLQWTPASHRFRCFPRCH